MSSNPPSEGEDTVFDDDHGGDALSKMKSRNQRMGVDSVSTPFNKNVHNISGDSAKEDVVSEDLPH